MAEERKIDLLAVGAGPTGLAAAIYTTRENIDTVLFEKGVIGGLAAITDSVENYPGFPEGVSGLELSQKLQQQAERFGAKIELGEVTDIKDEGEYKRVATTDGDILARAVLIGTGCDYVKLGVPGEQEFFGRGVHYCATCDGALYNGKRLVVVGSGNSAAQEGIFLTRFASSIDVLIRGDKWKASDILAKKLTENPKVKVHFNTTTEKIVGVPNGMVSTVIGHDKTTDKDVEFATDGVFVFVGLMPNTAFLKNTDVELDERGFVLTNEHLETRIPGVFAAGDVRHCATMQIASAVGEGATADLKIREYLEKD